MVVLFCGIDFCFSESCVGEGGVFSNYRNVLLVPVSKNPF